MNLSDAERLRLYPDGLRFEISLGRTVEIDGICPCTEDDDDEAEIRYSYFNVAKTHQTWCGPESYVTSQIIASQQEHG